MVRGFVDPLKITRNKPAGTNTAGLVWGRSRMGARFLFIGAISLCLVPEVNCAQAQDAPGDSEVLPSIEVNPPATVAKPIRSRSAPRTAARNLRRVFVYPTAPTATAGSGMDVDKVPASVNAVGAAQIARAGSLNIADALQQQVPG